MARPQWLISDGGSAARSDQRPSPEALLEAARREEGRVGKLRIFVGAAPGVGKTYEMLQQAHARKKDGYDVVIGVVETHGRRETEALLAGLEIVPRRHIEYKGQWLEEMDLDAIIARRPQLVLVDELAHTNAEGSRHPKRYLDVEELMSHSIDVYTTVNIQHIESLNDVVAQITHVRVRETVPDAVFDRADSVELVDLTPGDLIQRLKEGKVYVPRQAERALEHFFSPANLIALRELALRRTAERVDEQLLSEMQAHAIPGPWAAGERILVCISEDPRCAGLVRYAKRLADRLHGPWMALYVEGRRATAASEEERDRIADTLRLAEALGGEAVTLPAGDRRIADDVIRYAQANNVTQIVIGKSARSRWFEILHGSVVHDLVRRSGNISVHVIAGDAIAGEPIPKKSVRAAERDDTFNPRPYMAALVAVAFAIGFGELIGTWIGVEQRRSGLPDGDCGGGGSLRPAGRRCWPASRRRSPTTFSSCRRSTPSPSPIRPMSSPSVFFTLVAIIVSNVAARGRTQAMAATERARTTEVALFVQPQACRRRHARRRALGHRLSDRLMLKVRVVLLLARARFDRGQGRLSAGRHSRRRRSRRREMGVGERPRRRPRLRYAARRQAPVPADAYRPRRRSASWASTATSRARCSRPTSGACSTR